MKKYSFVIPTYNRKKLLKHTLDALNGQKGFSPDDYEAVVVDDGSDDDTWNYIQGINKTYALRYIYLERNSGSCRARTRNRGWKAAQGENIVFIDSDMLVKSSYLAELDRYYQIHKDLVVVGTRLMLPKGVIVDFDYLFDAYRFNSQRTALLDGMHFVFDCLSYNMSSIRAPGILFTTSNTAVPKRYLEAVDGFDESFNGWGMEDCELGHRLLQQTGLKFILSSRLEALHQYHPHEDSAASECTNNQKYFSDKHPYASDGLPMQQAFDIWKVLEQPREEYLKRFSSDRGEKRQQIRLDFKNSVHLDELKKNILHLSEGDGLDIEVNDHTEGTDLDVWIQLLGVRNSTPKYYPASRRLRKFSPGEIHMHFSMQGLLW